MCENGVLNNLKLINDFLDKYNRNFTDYQKFCHLRKLFVLVNPVTIEYHLSKTEGNIVQTLDKLIYDIKSHNKYAKKINAPQYHFLDEFIKIYTLKTKTTFDKYKRKVHILKALFPNKNIKSLKDFLRMKYNNLVKTIDYILDVEKAYFFTNKMRTKSTINHSAKVVSGPQNIEEVRKRKKNVQDKNEPKNKKNKLCSEHKKQPGRKKNISHISKVSKAVGNKKYNSSGRKGKNFYPTNLVSQNLPSTSKAEIKSFYDPKKNIIVQYNEKKNFFEDQNEFGFDIDKNSTETFPEVLISNVLNSDVELENDLQNDPTIIDLTPEIHIDLQNLDATDLTSEPVILFSDQFFKNENPKTSENITSSEGLHLTACPNDSVNSNGNIQIDNENNYFDAILEAKRVLEENALPSLKNEEYNFSNDLKLNTILSTCYKVSVYKDDSEIQNNSVTLNQNEELNPEDKIFWEFCYKRASDIYQNLSE